MRRAGFEVGDLSLFWPDYQRKSLTTDLEPTSSICRFYQLKRHVKRGWGGGLHSFLRFSNQVLSAHLV